MSNNSNLAQSPNVCTDLNAPMAWEVESTYLQRLERSSKTLHVAAEAMDIVLHGLDLDRLVFPGDASPEELRRRWAAQMLILSASYRNVSVQIDALRNAIATADTSTS